MYFDNPIILPTLYVPGRKYLSLTDKKERPREGRAAYGALRRFGGKTPRSSEAYNSATAHQFKLCAVTRSRLCADTSEMLHVRRNLHPPYTVKRGKRTSTKMARNDNRSELIVSLTIALVVTIIFIRETVVEWPTPFRLSEFQLEFQNPLAVLRHVPRQVIAGNN